jgi:glycosyltransferase involved in cell wall biosynthesis
MSITTKTTRDRPFISVVIDNYNYGDFVAAAVESALRLDRRVVEVIVVDDGSTDRSRDALHPFADCVHLVFKRNGGQASALNTVFACSRGDWVAFLDADDVLLEDFSAIVCRHAAPDVAKITWQMPIIGPDGNRTGQSLPPPDNHSLLNTLCRFGPLSFTCSPCSGNVWARGFLKAMMPIPEHVFRRGADGYLLQTSVIYGRTVVATCPGSAYRRHGANYLAAKSEFEVRDILRDRYVHLAEVVARHLRRNNVRFTPESWHHGHWEMLDKIESAVDTLITPDAHVILVDNDLLNVGSRFLGRPRLHL